jgi:hypothetical protein
VLKVVKCLSKLRRQIKEFNLNILCNASFFSYEKGKMGKNLQHFAGKIENKNRQHKCSPDTNLNTTKFFV